MLFIITGMGRSGSKFTAELLNKCYGGHVIHETPSDRYSCIKAYWNETKSLSFKRVDYMDEMEEEHGVHGEVSSYLRYHTDFLKQVMGAKVFHLVRDGRKVVRSMMNRSAFTDRDPHHTGRIKPYLEDIYFKVWNDLSRFQKICWYWNHAVTLLIAKKIPLLHFEKIISDYDYLNERLLKQVNLTLDRDVWEKEIQVVINANKSTGFPEYPDWIEQHKLQFNLICGSTMKLLGYQ